MNRKWFLIVLFVIYLVHEAWTLWPNSTAELQMFPFSDELISKQYYVFLACKYFIFVLFTAIIYNLLPEHQDIMKWFLIFAVLELIEFFIIYNQPWFHVELIGWPVGINITSLKVVTMFVLVTAKICSTPWNPGK